MSEKKIAPAPPRATTDKRNYIVDKASMKCSLGSAPGFFTVTNQGRTLTESGQKYANTTDTQPGLNFPIFGICSFLRGPCVMMGPNPPSLWQNPAKYKIVAGKPALLVDSYCMCPTAAAGRVEFIHSGQTGPPFDYEDNPQDPIEQARLLLEMARELLEDANLSDEDRAALEQQIKALEDAIEAFEKVDEESGGLVSKEIMAAGGIALVSPIPGDEVVVWAGIAILAAVAGIGLLLGGGGPSEQDIQDALDGLIGAAGGLATTITNAATNTQAQTEAQTEAWFDSFTYPGDGIRPPGRCDPLTYARFKAAKELACGIPRRCRPSMTNCSLIRANIAAHRACINARIKIMAVCFNGGDGRHWKEIENARVAMSKCFMALSSAGCI